MVERVFQHPAKAAPSDQLSDGAAASRPISFFEAMTPLRLVETDPALCYYCGGLLQNSRTILTHCKPAKEPNAWMG